MQPVSFHMPVQCAVLITSKRRDAWPTEACLEDGKLVVSRGHEPARAGLEEGQGSPAHGGCCATARNDCAYVYDQAQSTVVPNILHIKSPCKHRTL